MTQFNDTFLVSVATAIIRDPNTLAGLVYGKALLNSAFTMTLQKTEVRGGINNPLRYVYMHDKALEVKIEQVTFTEALLALNTGNLVSTSAITALCSECIDLTAGVGTITNTPLGNVTVFLGDTIQVVTPSTKTITVVGGGSSAVQVTYEYTVTADQLSIETIKPPSIVDLTLLAEVRDNSNNITDQLQIHIPKKTKGICLCLETVSHFPDEQEVIFSPNSKFKLLDKQDNPTKKISRQYIFNWIGKSKLKFERTKKCEINEISLMKDEKSKSLVLEEKINFFLEKVVNEQHQFIIKLDDKKIKCIGEFTDTRGNYQKFYSIKSENDFCIYSFYEGYLLFIFEIGKVDGIKTLRVNYYNKYNNLDIQKILDDDQFIKLISEVAFYFEIESVVIFSNYKSCEIGSYSFDLYNYITTSKQRYSKYLNIELRSKFLYDDIDDLRLVSPKQILSEDDNDEILQIYQGYSDKDNIIDFLLFIINKYCYLYDDYVLKISRINKFNPFVHDYYLFNPATYLYNRNLIKSYPTYITEDIEVERKILGV